MQATLSEAPGNLAGTWRSPGRQSLCRPQFPVRATLALLLFCLSAVTAQADTLRIATYNASLSRKGPGLLLNELTKGKSAQIASVVSIIQTTRPDILLINEFDFDPNGEAAALFIEALAAGDAPIDYPHWFSSPPNTGRPSGRDLNGDGKFGTPDDAFGWGRFPGQYGMLLLSRYPITETRTFANLLWQDLPGATLPENPDGTPFPSAETQAAMRLSSKSHWDIRLNLPGLGPLHIFASHPTPPVFDGPEDRNGLRNADEIRFWPLYIDGAPLPDDAGTTAPRQKAPFVILGDLNADPQDGDGIHEAIASLLAHPNVQDPQPRSQGAAKSGSAGANATHRADPAMDTADWRDDPGPGNLRVDYALPSIDLKVTGSGVFWPAPGSPGADLLKAKKRATSDHHLVWVDIELP